MVNKNPEKNKYVKFSLKTAKINPDMIIKQYEELIKEINKKITTADDMVKNITDPEGFFDLFSESKYTKDASIKKVTFLELTKMIIRIVNDENLNIKLRKKVAEIVSEYDEYFIKVEKSNGINYNVMNPTYNEWKDELRKKYKKC